jgi:hypothetical protein
VIGYCGSSGNAVGTAPHVHFGYYAGAAQDPMGFLLEWERRAEERARRAFGGELAGAQALTFARRFGDELVPGGDAISGDVVSGTIELLVDAVVETEGTVRPKRTSREPSGVR